MSTIILPEGFVTPVPFLDQFLTSFLFQYLLRRRWTFVHDDSPRMAVYRRLEGQKVRKNRISPS